MESELPFRLVAIAGSVVLMPIAARYRLRAHRTGEAIDRSGEGWFILATLRPIAALSMIAFLAYMVDPAWMAWAHLPLPGAVRWSGAAIGAFAGALLIWTMHTLGPNLTDTVMVRERAYLVTTGPYRVVRHPFYTAFGLAVVANALLTANAFIAATASIAFVLVLVRLPREEANLVRRFGDDYRGYMRRTSRLVPGLW